MPNPKAMSSDDLLFMFGMLDSYFSYAENEHTLNDTHFFSTCNLRTKLPVD